MLQVTQLSGFGVDSGVPLEWQDSFRANLPNYGGYLTGYTVRHKVPASALGLGGNAMRITIKAGSGTMTVNPCYIGEAASIHSYNFLTTPTQVLFGGSTSASISASQTIVSDEISLALDSSKTLLVSWYLAGGTGADTTGIASVDTLYAGGNSASNIMFSGGGGGGWIRGLEAVEALAPPP